MRIQNPSATVGRGMRLAALGVTMLLLAGCATGYSFVQPDTAGSGGYYTSNAPDTGDGYYYHDGTGPYFPATAGWAYYNGAWPYPDPFGWYGGYGYASLFTFGLGISNPWGFPGYWGSWFAGYPFWSCVGTGCTGWRHHHHHAGHRHGNADSAQPWLQPDHPPLSPRVARTAGSALPIAVPDRPLHPQAALAPQAFFRGNFMHAPTKSSTVTGFNPAPTHPAYMLSTPQEPAFTNRRVWPSPVPMVRTMRLHASPIHGIPVMPVVPLAAPPAHVVRVTHSHIP